MKLFELDFTQLFRRLFAPFPLFSFTKSSFLYCHSGSRYRLCKKFGTVRIPDKTYYQIIYAVLGPDWLVFTIFTSLSLCQAVCLLLRCRETLIHFKHKSLTIIARGLEKRVSYETGFAEQQGANVCPEGDILQVAVPWYRPQWIPSNATLMQHHVNCTELGTRVVQNTEID